MDKQRLTTYTPWVIVAIVTLAALVAWLQIWAGRTIGIYQIFPLLGILAWSIMWTHYAYGALTLSDDRFTRNEAYSKVTEWVVLGLILAHPALFAYKSSLDSGLLPPASYEYYVGAAGLPFVFMGVTALLIFLSYEYFGRARQKPWVQRNWRWVSLSQMIAMALIFIHSLQLGTLTGSSWFQYWWLLLGLALIPFFLVVGRADWTQTQK